MHWADRLAAVAVVVVMIILFTGAERNRDQFAKVCATSGGITVRRTALSLPVACGRGQ